MTRTQIDDRESGSEGDMERLSREDDDKRGGGVTM